MGSPMRGLEPRVTGPTLQPRGLFGYIVVSCEKVTITYTLCESYLLETVEKLTIDLVGIIVKH